MVLCFFILIMIGVIVFVLYFAFFNTSSDSSGSSSGGRLLRGLDVVDLAPAAPDVQPHGQA